MFKIFMILTFFSFSPLAMGSCASKIKAKLHRKLNRSGKIIALNRIEVTHKEKMEIEQGAFIKEMDRFEIQVLGENVTTYTGLTTMGKFGCRVEAVSELKPLFL